MGPGALARLDKNETKRIGKIREGEKKMNNDLTVGDIKRALADIPDDTVVIAEELGDQHRLGFAVWKLDAMFYDDDIELVTIRISHPIVMGIRGVVPGGMN